MKRLNHKASIGTVVIILIAMFLIPSFSNAQLTISAQYRPRAEFRDGYRLMSSSTTDPAFWISQRTRLNLDFSNERIDCRLRLQDVRVWGNMVQLQNIASTGVHEAWANIKFKKGISLKLGRQEWVYDDHRIFGNVDWIQPARAHDGALLVFKNEGGLKIDLGGAFNQSAENIFTTNYYLNNYKTLAFLRAEKQIGEGLNLSAVVISDGNTAKDSAATLFRETAGINAVYKSGGLGATGRFYYQFGQDNAYNDIAAYMANVEVSYKMSSFGVKGGVDIISGNDAKNTSDNTNRAFNTLFATNHKFYGWMDYFLNIPVHTKGGGLMDPFIGVSYSPEGKKYSGSLTAHYFMLAGNVLDPSDTTGTAVIDKALGTEVDLGLKYVLDKGVVLQGGYSLMMASPSMEIINGGDSDKMQSWAWLMINITPELFTTKDK